MAALTYYCLSCTILSLKCTITSFEDSIMSGLEQFLNKAKQDLETRFFINTPRDLEDSYNIMAKPSYMKADANHVDKAGQSAFFISERRYKAANLTAGFQSKDDVKDDVKAFLKVAILIFESGKHGLRCVLKGWELLAHIIAAMVDLADKDAKLDLTDAGDTLIDLVESGVKFVLYPGYASFEMGLQVLSFVFKGICSLHDNVGKTFDDAVDGISSFAQTAFNPA
jgi:hypothetical protein